MATARSRRWVKLIAGLLLGSAVGPLGGTAARAQPGTPIVQQNASAADLLLQAEQEINVGRYEEAARCLEQVARLRSLLGPQDRARFEQLSQLPRITVVRGAAGDTVATPAQEQAHEKLRQARLDMADYKFEEAEKLAREAEAANVSWGRTEDSPSKALEEVARLRADGKVLLAGARHWLAHKDYDRAEKLALMAEKAGTGWTLNPFADTPAWALKEIRAARPRKTAGNPIQQVAGTSSGGNDVLPAVAVEVGPKSPESRLQEARDLIVQGRKALQVNDLKSARALGEKARALRANFQYWEDLPERFLADVARAENGASTSPAASVNRGGADPQASPAIRTKEQALVQLKIGRTLFADNKLDQALEIAVRLRGLNRHIRWGLFEDSPEALYRDVSQACKQRDQELAGRALAEARQLFARGDLNSAEAAAQRAQKLHGPYSVFDFGDRPTKLLAEIDAARAKQRPTGMPPARIARTDPERKQSATPPTAGNPATQCQSLLAEARLALSQGDSSKAYNLAQQASDLKLRYNLTLNDSPEVILAEAQHAGGVKTVGAVQVEANDPAAQARKQQATTILATARLLEKQGNLIEARKKAQEAMIPGTVFGPTEDSPDVALQQINGRAAQTVAALVHTASETLTTGHGNPVEIALKAEATLAQARALALAFGLDTQAVDTQIGIVQRMKGGPGVASVSIPPAPGTVPVPAPGATAQVPAGSGAMLLASARTELRKGELNTARKMAEEAYRGGPAGVQEDAVKILRSIDAEESRQRSMTANRTFDAANQAYQRGDYKYASSLIATITDARQLDANRQSRLREIMMTPPMQPSSLTASPIPTVPGGGGTQPVRNDQPTSPGAVGKAVVSDSKPPQPGILETTAAMREIRFQQLRAESLKAQSEATERFRNGQIEQALDLLQTYLAALNDSGLEANQSAMLRRSVESRLKQYNLLKEQEELVARNQVKKENAHSGIGRQQLAEAEKHKKTEELMKQFNAFFKEGKYAEAGKVAMQAHEIDADNPVFLAAITIAKRQDRLDEIHANKDEKENFNYKALTAAEKGVDGRLIDENQVFDNKVWKTASQRKDRSTLKLGKSLKEREIETKLNTPVTLNFKDVPLYSVIDDLRAYHGLNIWVDKQALEVKGISLDRPVEVQLGNVALKTCLNLMLQTARLTYVIREDVLQITTPEAARGKQETRTFLVTDLVIGIPDFDKLKTVQNGNQSNQTTSGMSTYGGPTPVQSPFSIQGGQNIGTPTGSPMSEGTSIQKSNSPTQEDSLIKLITNTIEPKSWDSMGGPGTIQFFPLSNTLVINQTTDIQEQIADLLQALRRLQDQEVAVEIRFITITEDFYERIGVNFSLNIANPDGQRYAPQLLSGVGNPNATQFNSFIPSHLVSGLNQAGGLTPDLSIPINNNSFFSAIPNFGGYAPGVGGISMGLAFLSDIQVFLFLEAVQGDTRNNVMMAPKLTLFNGQTATLNTAQAQINYLTNVQLIQGPNGQFFFQPQFQGIPVQAQNLILQAVITADRRFVRMSLNPTLTNLVPGPIQAIPLIVPLFPAPPSAFAGPTGDPIIMTQFIQQPGVTTVGVGTTVMVPDGGTVLLGGLKYLSESRNEYGPPILGKIPGLDRLFRNVGYGRSTGSLLIMVTPRIIIQEEEEERATGFQSRPLIGAGGR